MQIINLKIIVTLLIISLLSGCALSDALAENYRANIRYQKTHGRKIAQKRDQAKDKFVREKTQELINMYGTKRGYLIAQKSLTDENIQYHYDSVDFHPYIDNKTLVKYINETRGLENDNEQKKTIVIITR